MVKDYKKTILTYLIYFFLPVVVLYIMTNIIGRGIKGDVPNVILYSTICDALLFIILIIFNLNLFKNNKEIEGSNKSKIYNFINKAIELFVLFFAVKIASGMVVTILLKLFNLGEVSADNQATLMILFKESPILMTLTGVICAPVIEEIVFRGVVKKIIKNKWVFIIVSGLIFGLVHVLRHDLPIFILLILGYILDIIISSKLDRRKKVGISICTAIMMFGIMIFGLHIITGNVIDLMLSIKLSEIINSVVYIAVGIYLGYVYYKYENIYMNISLHAMNNLLSYILIFTSL